jgi:hypothetical protein
MPPALSPDAAGVPPALKVLPRQGSAPNDVKRQLKYKEGEDLRFSDGDSRVSGAHAGAAPPAMWGSTYVWQPCRGGKRYASSCCSEGCTSVAC